MKIIFANRYFHPDQSATSRMVSALAFALAKRGLEVCVLTSRHWHDRRQGHLQRRETIAGVEIHRLRDFGFGRRRMLGRAADYAAFHLSAAVWLARNARRDDICVVCTDPPLLSLSAYAPLRLRGARLANWVMDLFPETAMELGMVEAHGLSGRALLALRDRIDEGADIVLCPTRSMAWYLEKRRAVAHSRIAVVPHWSDGSEIRPVPREANALCREWGIADRFVVGYSGNFGRAHEFDTLLDAAERLRDDDRVAFLLVGDGQQHAYVKGEVERRGLTNVVFRPLQPSARLAESLGAADIHIVSLIPRLEHCIVPSKVYGILAAARPAIFVGDPRGEVARVLEEGACGLTVRPGEGERLAAHLTALCDDRRRASAMGDRARRLFDAEYACEKGVARWLHAISPLLAAEVPVATVESGEIA